MIGGSVAEPQSRRAAKAGRHGAVLRSFASLRHLAKGFLPILASLLATSCSPREWHIAGRRMGTTWQVTVVPPRDTRLTEGALRDLVQRRLDELDFAFTNWNDNAPVPRFNVSRSMDWQDMPRELVEMVRFAQELSERTGGAFDITIAPLVDLWGFGPKGRVPGPPSDAAIAGAMQHVGWKKLEARDEPPALRKRDPELQINVSAMADGYACAELAGLFRAGGVENFLIEIGGAVLGWGLNAEGRGWRVGIQRPEAADGDTMGSITLHNQAVSTSGVYRQYFERRGRRFAHVLDARTGRPVVHDLLSVSVVGDSAFKADGWDTALLILGPGEGRALAEKLKLDAMFLRE